MKPSRKLQKEMTPREGVSTDEITLLMCDLINVHRGTNAPYNHPSILIHIGAKQHKHVHTGTRVSAEVQKWPNGQTAPVILFLFLGVSLLLGEHLKQRLQLQQIFTPDGKAMYSYSYSKIIILLSKNPS